MLSSINAALLWLSSAGYAFLLLRLFSFGLLKLHFWFAVHILIRLIRELALIVVPNKTVLYGHVYFGTLPLLWISSILVVLSAYQIVLKDHPGLRRLGRYALVGALVLGSLGGAAALALGTGEFPGRGALLARFLLVEQALGWILSIFIIAIIGFLACFPIQVSRNALVQIGLFSAFFLVRSVILLFRNTSSVPFHPALSLTVNAATVICLFLWIGLLRPQSEDRIVTSGPTFTPEQEKKILAQLAALNQTISGSSRLRITEKS